MFANTGDERPDTYRYVELFDRYLREHDFPGIETIRWIRKDGETFIPLGQWCRDGKTLPSKAFGMSGCTSKWKQQPLDKRVRKDPRTWAVWSTGQPVERWIGYDTDEPERAERMMAKNPEPALWRWRAPLVEWGMGRAECVESIAAAGLPQPGKSSCYFCPSMRKAEIIELGRQYPDLLQKALDLEANAEGLTSCKGLGRSFAWRDVVEQKPTACEVVDQECGCYDGE